LLEREVDEELPTDLLWEYETIGPTPQYRNVCSHPAREWINIPETERLYDVDVWSGPAFDAEYHCVEPEVEVDASVVVPEEFV